MERAPGMSARVKLTLSYAGVLLLAGAVLLAAGYFSLSRGVPASRLVPRLSDFPLALDPHNFGPTAFGAAAVLALAFLLLFGLVGGWILAGRMLAPLTRITAADRLDDKASGFELGADDYLTKPFALQELVLRLRALDRRRAHHR